MDKKNYSYCVNCGNNGHVTKKCPIPLTSYGVSLLKLNINNEELIKYLLDSFTNFDAEIDINNEEGINVNSLKDVEIFSEYKDKIKFLLIRRKHSLGYIEFIRGKYFVDKTDGIIFLFKQMVPEEIEKIRNYSFDELWFDLWGEHKSKTIFQNDKNISEEKYNILKEGVHEGKNYINLQVYLDNVKCLWDNPEWGFPKGRRNSKESDRACAVREFIEETGFNKDDYCMLTSLGPLTENLIGTNGIPYKHVYYVGITLTDKIPTVDKTNSTQNCEIGDIKYVTYTECIKLIRNYHTDRLKIVSRLYFFMMNQIIKFYNSNEL